MKAFALQTEIISHYWYHCCDFY